MSSSSPSAREKLVAQFRAYCEQHPFTRCRIVHYAGAGRPNAADIRSDDAENQVAGCLDEGFAVRWAEFEGALYLAIQEPDCPFPSWQNVRAEEAVVDEEAILRQAGFGDAV
jgi:hypothetical protein